MYNKKTPFFICPYDALLLKTKKTGSTVATVASCFGFLLHLALRPMVKGG